MSKLMVRNEHRLLAMIDRAAKAGLPSPTNDQICAMMGFGSTASAARLVEIAIDHGAITARYPNQRSRFVELTALGHQQLAALAADDAAALDRPVERERRTRATSADVADLPPVDDRDERLARTAAIGANERFLAALAKLTPVADARDTDTTRFTRLPPPALNGQAFS